MEKMTVTYNPYINKELRELEAKAHSLANILSYNF